MVALQRGKIIFGTGVSLKSLTFGTLSVVHGTILPNRMGTVSTAVTGMAATDMVTMSMPASPTAGVGYGGCAPASGTLHVFLVNPTAGTISPGTLSMPYLWHDLT